MNGFLRDEALRLARPIHVRLRNKKVPLFRQHLSGTELTLLDVGSVSGIAGEFEQPLSQFSNVVSANLRISRDGLAGNRVLKIIADSRQLPFADGSFDGFFSNAVIEHVGDYEKQRLFADEIRRVASKGYFVTTPSRHFPIEPHTLLPFYQFLSPAWQRRVVRLSPGYLQEYEEIHVVVSPPDEGAVPGSAGGEEWRSCIWE